MLITSGIASKFNLSENIASRVLSYTAHNYSYFFRAYSMEIRNWEFNNVIMGFISETNFIAFSSTDHIGLLGNGILERFDVVIDFINYYLYLKPNPNFHNNFNSSGRGFGYVDRSVTMNAWIVTGLIKGSNAEIAGLKIDDKIISVNSIDIHKIPFKEQAGFWEQLDNVTLIVLRNGEEKSIEFDFRYVL